MDAFSVAFKKHWFFFALCPIVCVLYYLFFINMSHVELQLEVEKNTVFKMYWAKKGAEFSEENMVKVPVTPDKKHYSFFLTNLKNKERLRIDPVEYAGVSRVERLAISQPGLQPIIFDSPQSFAALTPLFQIAEHSADTSGLQVISSGIDGNFLYPIQLAPAGWNYAAESARLAGLLLLLAFVYWAVAHLQENLAYVPYLLFGVAILVVTMSLVSERNVHPDEFVHIAASQYYVDHWNPPRLDDPAIANTFSPYGVSRLATNEIYYLVNGKFAALLQLFQLNQLYASRILNLFLFLAIVLISLRSVTARYMAAVFLITPQFWYIFSYCNSDAFAAFIAFIAGCLVVNREGMLHRFLRDIPSWRWLLFGLASALLMGMLFLVKMNYYSFIAVVFCILLFDIYKNYAPGERKKVLIRLGVICLAGISLLVWKKLSDYRSNDWDFRGKVQEMKVKMAYKAYHSETPLEQKHPLLYKQSRGVELKEIVVKDRWFEKTFRSFFGVYGYHTLSGSNEYYNLARWIGCALLFYFLANIFIRGGWYHSSQAILIIGMSSLLIAASLYHSWTSDFQAQGRYLFPVLAMLSVLFAQTRFILEKRLLTCGLGAMFILSCYSFIQVALHGIARSAL